MEIHRELMALADADFKAFHARLIPNVPEDRIIGIRTPVLKRFAAELAKDTARTSAFLKELPHRYYEENNLHALLLMKIKDYDVLMRELDRFLPYVDNWATCDMLIPPVVKKHPERLWADIRRFVASGKTYTVRFGLSMLMKFKPESEDIRKALEICAAVTSDEYYVNMMRAWFFATALAKDYDRTLPYLTARALDVWTHNKTIQKAIESYRITPEQKTFLRTLKVGKADVTKKA